VFETIIIDITKNSFLMMILGSILASSFHLHNGNKLLNPFSENGITRKNNWIEISINIIILTIVSIILAHLMYTPPSGEGIKALFAGASTMMFLNNADINNLKDEK
jgi:hypothetical protein